VTTHLGRGALSPRARRWAPAAAAVALGCLSVTVREAPLPAEPDAGLGAGATRGDVLARLGPPDEIVRPAAAGAARTGPDPLARFPAEARAVPRPVVWVYRRAVRETGPILPAFVPVAEGDVTTSELWILIDEESGLLRATARGARAEPPGGPP
jgi:hypothetical protein